MTITMTTMLTATTKDNDNNNDNNNEHAWFLMCFLGPWTQYRLGFLDIFIAGLVFTGPILVLTGLVLHPPALPLKKTLLALEMVLHPPPLRPNEKRPNKKSHPHVPPQW